jgi:EAL domain-containing protein (putative c-di-GMP-specific phosphodiesterase class I)
VLGIQIAVDDFGTGYSSLSYLHRLPIDTLKIDRSFVEKIADPGGTRPIVETIMSLARSLGMRTVAEGVETQAQLDIIRELNCDFIQGFLFSPPVSGPEVLELLTTSYGSGALCQSPR